MQKTSMMNPDVVRGMLELSPEVLELEGGKRVLLTPRMFGVPQMVAAGEQSAWLLALKEKAVVLGARCPRCRQVYAPAYCEWCGHPPCRFQKLDLIELPDVGVITDAEPVITLFAPARMSGQAPFAHGLVHLKDAEVDATVDMMFALETTDGVIRPGIYQPGTPVKLVFEDDGRREGCVTDVMCLPRRELSPQQLAKRPLFRSDVDWREPAPPQYAEHEASSRLLAEVRERIARFFEGVNDSPRNQARLRVLEFSVRVVTGGGSFAIAVRRGAIGLLDSIPQEVTTTIAAEDPRIFEQWTRGKALTNRFALGELWLSNRAGVRLLEDLDRLWRAALRDGVLVESSLS
jgi:uncharacterized OB-fold protein